MSHRDELVLASASPRRAALLQQIGIRFRQQTADIDERRLAGESPADYVRRLALDKARAVYQRVGSEQLPVLGSDTTVVVDDDLLGKPATMAEHVQMMKRLSGRSHRVLTAVAIVSDDERVISSETRVFFRAITEYEAECYWQTGEPADKAGGYAIQGLGAAFIERIDGSYSGVMGLPLFETGTLLEEFGIQVLGKK